MRDWQIGDPIGDGNDIGVPDVAYMGRRGDDDLVDEFKSDWNLALNNYNRKDYESAFISLDSAFSIYSKLSDFEKSQLSDEPFNRDWITDLCCRMINDHGKYYRPASDILIKILPHVKVCKDCDCIYPAGDSYCIRCGQPLLDPFESSPDNVESKVRKGLLGWVFDEGEIQTVVDRSLRLIKSNGSRLVEIRRGIYGNFDFVFVKEHRYFKTTYTCEYLKNRAGGRVFEDFSSFHNHDRLVEDKAFQKLICDTEEKTGFKFKECSGGYGYDFDEDHYNFIFTDKISVTARFDMPDGRTAVYDIDLDNMKLSDDYMIY